MMRLPRFRYLAPASALEASRILAGEGRSAMLLAGGTELRVLLERTLEVLTRPHQVLPGEILLSESGRKEPGDLGPDLGSRAS